MRRGSQRPRLGPATLGLQGSPEGPTVVLTGMLTAREGSWPWRTRSPKYASFAASAKPPLHCHLPGLGTEMFRV
jgi:hypothetical protein